MNNDVEKKQTVFCSSCGAKNLLVNTYCSSCGERMVSGVIGNKPGKSSIESNDYNWLSNLKQKRVILIAGVLLTIILMAFLVSSLFSGNDENISYNRVLNETTWHCQGVNTTFHECMLPVNYTAETGFTKVSIATCEGGDWQDLSYQSSDKPKIVVGICMSGKCAEMYGKVGLVRLISANNSCPVGSWNY